jgi:hypothetical protein
MRALAAVDSLMLILRMHDGFFLVCRREMPCGRFLMIDPYDRMVV